MNYIALQSILLWNWLHTMRISFYHRVSSFFMHLVDYWYDRYNTWIFVSHDSIPIPLSHVTHHNFGEWCYHSTTNNITYLKGSDAQEYTIKWLSAQLIIDVDELHHEYDIDDFMSTFTIHGPDPSTVPSLRMIYVCWCITKKKWFSSNAMITLIIIDSEGNRHRLILTT